MANPATNVSTEKTPAAHSLTAPGLLLATGALLGVSIILSRMAADHGAPMLWFLTVVMFGSGLILVAAAILTGKAKQGFRTLLLYGIGAGAFQAVPQAMAYLSVAHVGAGYVSIAFAFPLLVTYVLALVFGMERLSLARALGVGVALAGGLMLVLAKFDGLAGQGDAALWVVVASLIPVVIAGGNLYRTKFWPAGAAPLPLAALMMVLGGLMILPFAAWTEGSSGIAVLWQNPGLPVLTCVATAVFALKFATYFQLQHVAGPVYLSQIGTVGAAVATPIAVVYLSEVLPENFTLAIMLIAVGVILFEYGRRRQQRT